MSCSLSDTCLFSKIITIGVSIVIRLQGPYFVVGNCNEFVFATLRCKYIFNLKFLIFPKIIKFSAWIVHCTWLWSEETMFRLCIHCCLVTYSSKFLLVRVALIKKLLRNCTVVSICLYVF